MKKLFSFAVCMVFYAGVGFAAQTWTGKISDSMCGATHKAMEHGGKKLSDRDCVQACVKDGAKYVFVSQGKVYEVTNQDFAGLAQHAGHTVKLTGDMSSDKKSVTVSSIEMPTSKLKGKAKKT